MRTSLLAAALVIASGSPAFAIMPRIMKAEAEGCRVRVTVRVPESEAKYKLHLFRMKLCQGPATEKDRPVDAGGEVGVFDAARATRHPNDETGFMHLIDRIEMSFEDEVCENGEYLYQAAYGSGAGDSPRATGLDLSDEEWRGFYRTDMSASVEVQGCEWWRPLVNLLKPSCRAPAPAPLRCRIVRGDYLMAGGDVEGRHPYGRVVANPSKVRVVWREGAAVLEGLEEGMALVEVQNPAPPRPGKPWPALAIDGPACAPVNVIAMPKTLEERRRWAFSGWDVPADQESPELTMKVGETRRFPVLGDKIDVKIADGRLLRVAENAKGVVSLEATHRGLTGVLISGGAWLTTYLVEVR